MRVLHGVVEYYEQIYFEPVECSMHVTDVDIDAMKLSAITRKGRMEIKYGSASVISSFSN